MIYKAVETDSANVFCLYSITAQTRPRQTESNLNSGTLRRNARYKQSGFTECEALRDDAVHMFVCLFVCRLKRVRNTRFFSKTKHFRAMVSIDDDVTLAIKRVKEGEGKRERVNELRDQVSFLSVSVMSQK